MVKKIYPLKNTIILLFLQFALIPAFGQTFFQTQCIQQENVGSVSFQIWDRKKGTFYKIEMARKDAIRAVLLAGIGKGEQCSGMNALLRTEKERTAFQKMEANFFAKDGAWTRFTQQSIPVAAFPMAGQDQKLSVFQVTVAREELRKYLEEQKIIQALTTGF